MDQTTSANSPESARTERAADPANAKPEKWLRVADFCALYGFNVDTIYKAINEDRIKWKMAGASGSKYQGRLVLDDPTIFEGKTPIEAVAFIKTEEAAEIIGISSRAIQYYITRGQVKAFKAGTETARRYYLPISSVRKIISLRANYGKGKRKKRTRQAIIDLVRHKLLSAG